MITVGKKIQYLRKQQHMTQKQLGLAVGFSESTADVRIAQYESGARAPKVNILVSGNLDSGILETDIPEEGNSLIGLFTTYQVVRYCQAQSRFAVL